MLLASVLAGCSTYANQSVRLRQAALDGDRLAALRLLDEEHGEDPDQLALLQRGLLHFEEGRDSLAIADFAAAERTLDENFTKSLSREALAFLTNDATRAYVPYPSEQVLLHFYAALSYLERGDRPGALVELRKAGRRLQALEDLRQGADGYRDDPFVEWISALLFADDGDANAAMVSFRRGLAAFEEEDRIWAQAVPHQFLEDYHRAAWHFGFPEEAQELLDRFDGLDARVLPDHDGDLVLLFGCGFANHLEELRTDFPILESDDVKDDEKTARRIYRRGHRGRYVRGDDVKIAYWLSVAIPVLVRSDEYVRRARLVVDDQTSTSQRVADVSAAFDLTFEEGEGRRMVRTILRALTKYLAVEAVKNKKDGKENKAAGFLANLVTAATERADTRSWTLLPDNLQMARLRLPAGEHPVHVEFLDAAERIVKRVDLGLVHVAAGRHTFLYQRTYR